VVLEDVVTTGGSALEAVTAAREFGLTVVQVIILVDREDGGRETVEEQISRVQAVFTLAQLKGGS
jgi:orotate phosphoribosyltransferase